MRGLHEEATWSCLLQKSIVGREKNAVIVVSTQDIDLTHREMGKENVSFVRCYQNNPRKWKKWFFRGVFSY